MRIKEATQKTVAIYPGRFHPFHKGHASVYAFLKSKFDTVYITTSNKIDPPKSPFSFEEKRAMMVHAGIPASSIVQARQPYIPVEILKNFDPKTTNVVFAVSQKDMDDDPRFAFKPKKDGSPSYFQPAAGADMVGLDTHGYVMVAPTLNFTVLGEPMKSATEFRRDFADADEEKQKQMITDLYGSYSEQVHNIMRNKIKEHADPYLEHVLAAESVLHDLTMLYEHRSFDMSSVTNNAQKIIDKINTIPVVETLDYLDPKDVMDSIVAVPGVGTMSIRGLMSNIKDKMSDLADRAASDQPTAFRDIKYRLDSNIIGVMVDALANAFDDIEAIRRKGGKNSAGIPKNVFDSVMHFHEAWSAKYKRSIDCNNPKGFSQKAHCAGRNKTTEDVITEYMFQSIPLRVLDNLSSRKDNKPFPIKTGKEADEVFNVTPEIARKFMNLYYQKEPEVQKAIDKTLNNPRKFIELFTNIMSGKKVSGAAPTDIAPDKLTADVNEAGVGIITKQNTTPDVKPGETQRQSKKLGLGSKPKLLHKSAAKNSDPNTLFNLGIAEIYTPLAIAIMEGGHELPDFEEVDESPIDDILRINKKLELQRDERESALKSNLMQLMRQAMGLKRGSKEQVELIKDMNKIRKGLLLDPIAIPEAFVEPQFDVEWNEAARYPEFVAIGKDAWIELAKTGKAVTIKDASDIENTDAADSDSFKSLDPNKQKRALAQLEKDEVEMPIVAVYSDGFKELIAGNTRLTAMMAEKGKATVWQFEVPDEVATLAEAVSQVDIEQLERFADKMFAKVGIDVEFTRHFLDRVNDARNQKDITPAELTRLFKQTYKRYGKPIATMGPGAEAVMKDLQTDINLPFALRWDRENNELDLIAKTVMRKKDFKTSNKEFAVERGGINVPFANGTVAQIVPHRALKVKKSTPGRLSHDQPETKRKRNK